MLTKEKKTERRMKNRKVITVLFVICSLLFGMSSQAQCAMCRASLESTGDTSQAQAVNDGIVYLMIIPYVLVALIGFAIYKMFQKKKEI
jgi:hypothetical protein